MIIVELGYLDVYHITKSQVDITLRELFNQSSKVLDTAKRYINYINKAGLYYITTTDSTYLHVNLCFHA